MGIECSVDIKAMFVFVVFMHGGVPMVGVLVV